MIVRTEQESSYGKVAWWQMIGVLFVICECDMVAVPIKDSYGIVAALLQTVV